ncbi:MAG: putative phosphomutase, family [Actinomycetia bacterium]|nr:putative phosphomutase, family [Actinomycetes bacterium]
MVTTSEPGVAPAPAPGMCPESDVDTVGAAASTPEAEAQPEAKPEPVKSTRIVLVRHGVTAETGKVLYGREDGHPLSEKGVEQVEATAARLAAFPIAAVYSSPIERTRQTAAPIAESHGLTVELLDAVVESDAGDFTGQTFTELAKLDSWKAVHRSPSRFAFPGGESFASLQARTVTAIEELAKRHPGETIVVVSHADPIRAALVHYTGSHLDHIDKFAVSPASVNIIEVSPYGASVLKFNDTGGLDELRAPEPAAEASTTGDTPASGTES